MCEHDVMLPDSDQGHNPPSEPIDHESRFMLHWLITQGRMNMDWITNSDLLLMRKLRMRGYVVLEHRWYSITDAGREAWHNYSAADSGEAGRE